MTALSTSLTTGHAHLRPFNASRDLLDVANLIEICFADTLDADGRRYVRQLRAMAGNTAALRWMSAAQRRGPVPAAGFVWEERGRIVGNLSLIPFSSGGERFYLIANVAVDPAYRRRGIGKALTQAGVEYALRYGSAPPWLQVRADNPGALRMYQTLGFTERARRNTWRSTAAPVEATLLAGMQITARKRSDWPLQKRWFEALYPERILWQFNFAPRAQNPGLGGWLYRLWTGTFLRQWSLRFRGRLIGVLTWQSNGGSATTLWLSLHPAYERLSLPALLWFARQRLHRFRLAFNYPAGRAEDVISTHGFRLQHTLVWMRWQG